MEIIKRVDVLKNKNFFPEEFLNKNIKVRFIRKYKKGKLYKIYKYHVIYYYDGMRSREYIVKKFTPLIISENLNSKIIKIIDEFFESFENKKNEFLKEMRKNAK